MGALELLVQFGTVFLGAFLAFGLENVRERRQLRGWANDYLKRVREGLLKDKSVQLAAELEGTVEAYSTVVALAATRAPSEDEWGTLLNLQLRLSSDYRALLEGAAARVLPAELVQQLGELEGCKRTDATLSDLTYAAWQQYVVPLALRRGPLSEAERRGVAYTQALLRVRLGYLKETVSTERRVLELLTKHNLGH